MKVLSLLKTCTFIVLVAPTASYAFNCTSVPSITLSPSNITVPRELPVGAKIGSEITTAVITPYQCENNSASDIQGQTFGGVAYGDYLTMIDGHRIYRTNIAGIGYGVDINYVGRCEGRPGAIDGNNTIDGNPNTKGPCISLGFMDKPHQASFKITYYKTAAQTGSGIVTGKPVAAFVLKNNAQRVNPEVAVNMTSFNVTTLACTVNNSAISVPMGTITKSSFSGPGTWPGDSNTKSFNIPLMCNANAKINLRIDGSVQNANQGLLNINTTSNAAKGVGIQLLYQDNPLVIGKNISVGTTSRNGDYNIALKSRYFQTASTITGGEANASATFTIIYE